METKIAVIRIKLKDAPIPIWRRIHLNPNITLAEFHEIIQIVMGWYNCHLYGFRVDGKFYTIMEDIYGDMDLISPESVSLKEIIDSNKKFIYEYDFGDGWKHEIVFNKYIEPKKDVEYPICASGKGICPPEDIGGVWRYANFLNEARSENPSDYILETIHDLGYELDEVKEIENIPLDIEFINHELKDLMEFLKNR